MSNEIPWLRVVLQRTDKDCAVAALAMYVGVTYEDAFAAILAATGDIEVHRRGTWKRDIVAAAKLLSVKLVTQRKPIDLDNDSGILGLDGHVVILREGMIVDTDGIIWEHESFFKNYPALKVLSLLTRGE